MSKKKGHDEERRRSFTADFTQDPPGTFCNGRRITTPTGAFVIPPRPISQLASRFRGVCAGAQEDNDEAASPRAISAGGVRQVRSVSATMGKHVNLPRELLQSRGAATPVTKTKQFVEVPDLQKLSHWICESRSVSKAKGAGALYLTPSAKATAETLFTGSNTTLHRNWQRLCLSGATSLDELPTVCVGIENVTEQPQLARVATLLYATMQFRQSIQQGNPPPIRYGKEVGNMEALRNLFDHTIGPDGKGIDRPQYHENARHVIVSYKGEFYEFEVVEPQGRLLVASEIHKRLQLVTANAAQPACSLPTHSLSSLPREECRRLSAEWGSHCAANRIGLELLNSAICVVHISEDAGETLEYPALGFGDDDARWAGKSTLLCVHPNGNAMVRCAGTLVDAATVRTYAKWIAHAANCDPMLQPLDAPVETMTALRRTPRTPTPTNSKRPPKGKAAQQVDETPEIAQVTVTMPPPPPAADPKHIPLWMPLEYCRRFSTTSAPSGVKLLNFELSLKEEYSLYLGTLLALHYVDASRLPVVHAVRNHASRDPATYHTMSKEVESCLRYVAQYTQFGPLRSEVNNACIAAVRKLRETVGGCKATPHISNMRALYQAGAVKQTPHAKDFELGNVFGPAHLAITKQDHDPDLLWTMEAHTLPVDLAPLMLSYYVTPAHRSSLRSTLGGMATCSLTIRQPPTSAASEGGSAVAAAADGQVSPVDHDKLVASIKLFTKFVDDCVAVNTKTSTASQMRAATPSLCNTPELL